MLTEKQIEKLRDRHWRLNNLYFIQDKDTLQPVRFKMSPEQLEYYEGAHSRNIILKARQLGFTTEVCMIQLDLALFHSKRCAMIAHTLPDAERLFREKIMGAYDRLPDEIKASNPIVKQTTSELVFQKGGSVTVSTSFRGGTLYSLHVSEFGKICARHPHKAREIVTGAFEAVPKGGQITLESTAEGSSGYFYDYCQDAENAKLKGTELGVLDFKFFFFSWFTDKNYQVPVTQELPERLANYFDELEAKHGIKTTPEQRAWYWSKEKQLGEDIRREYPSIPAEAFQNSVKGAYYKDQFKWLYANGRVGKLPSNDHIPVMTFWDLGVADSMAIWFVRKLSETSYQVIDYYENSGEGLRHYFKVLKDRSTKYGYRYGDHYAPHDIKNRSLANDAKSRLDIAKEGYEIDGAIYSVSFKVVDSVGIMDGIEQTREILKLCEFDENRCSEGISHLENYRKEWDDKRGCWKDRPLHDNTSHGADAFRMFGVAMGRRKRVARQTRMRGLL